MAGLNGVRGPTGLSNGKPRQLDSVPGVSFGPGLAVQAASTAEDVQRMNALAFQDDAIIAAGPSTPSTVARGASPQPASILREDADPEAALLEHIVSMSCRDACRSEQLNLGLSCFPL